MIKKALKYIGILLIGLIIALFVLPFVFEDEIKDGVRQALNDSLNAKSDFKDISLSFFSDFPNATVTIDSLQIDGIDTFDQVPLFHTQSLSIEIALPSLLQKEKPYQVKSVMVDKPLINILQLANGHANYLITKNKKAEESTSYQIALDHYEIKSGRIRYQDLSGDITVKAEKVNHSGKGAFTQAIYDLNSKTDIDLLNIQYGNIPILIDGKLKVNATVNVDLNNEKYTFAENQVNLNEVLLNFAGYLQMKDEGLMTDITFDSPEADFGKIYSLVPYAYNKAYADAQINGNGQFSGIVQGIYNAETGKIPHYDCKLTIDKGSIKYPQLPKNISNIVADINVKNGQKDPDQLFVNIPTFNIQMDQDYVKGRFVSAGTITNPKLEGELQTNLHLADWKKALPIAEDTEIKGVVNADIKLDSYLQAIQKKAYNDIVFSGNISAEDLLYKASSSPASEVQSLKVALRPSEISGSLTGALYRGSDFRGDFKVEDPLNYFIENASLRGFVNLSSQTLDLNPYLAEDQKTEEAVTHIKLPKGRININAQADNLIFGKQNYINNEATGYYQDGSLIINDVKSFYGKSDFNGSGEIHNMEAYLNKTGDLTGNIQLVSKNLNVNDFMTSEETDSTEIIAVPPAIDIDINARVQSLNYQEMVLKNVKGNLEIVNEAINMEAFNSTSMGGNLLFEGLYATPEGKDPSFNIKVDLSKIKFAEAFQQVKAFRMLAPIGKYLEGIFNTTLVMNAKLGQDMMPIWSSLNASGYIETLNGALSGYGPLNNIGDKIGLNALKTWTITNTKNWFEVDDGVLLLKDKTYELGQDLEVNFSGSHVLGGDMDYQLIFSIPRALLRKSSTTAALESGLSAIEAEAGKLGINLDQGANLLVKVGLQGLVDNPKISVKPMGTSGKKLDDLAKEELAKKKEEAIDKITDEVTQKKEEITDTLQKEIDKAKDSIADVIDKKKEAAKDSLEKLAKKEISDRLDSLKKNPAIDSVAQKAEDIFKETTGKEVNKLQEELNKWNPFKKKSKTDTSKKKEGNQ